MSLMSEILCVVQAGGLGDRLAESAASATDPLARQGAFESYTALMKDIGNPIEPFVAGVLSTIFDKCSDKVRNTHHHLPFTHIYCLCISCHFHICQAVRGFAFRLLKQSVYAVETELSEPELAS